jgi:hypothetical protein
VGVYGGPEIPNDGLVLALDAANNKSILSTVEVLVVAGGGGGGMDMGGGGGAGGVIYSSAVSITPGSAITATVGNGGVGAPAGSTNGQPGGHQFTISATQGGNSVFGALTAIGGGFGASSYYGYLPNYGYGGTGGSGGGCSGYTHGGERYVDGTNGSTANNTAGQGFVGGNSGNPSSGGDDHYSGGGGGAGGRGTSGPNHIGPNGIRGDGGSGVLYPSMSPYYFAGGGGGSGYSGNGGYGGIGGGGGGSATNGNVGLAGTGGINIGSNGSSGNNAPGGNAGANTGGGGGGGSHYNANNKGGDGGSGIIIVRYPGSQRASGGTVTFVAGHTIHTFTTSGTFTPNGAPGTGTIWTDFSNNGNSGTLVNGVGYSASNGGSLSFDGSNDYVTTGYNPGIVTKLTVSVWLKVGTYANDGAGIAIGTNSLGTGQCYLGRGTSGGNSIDWRFYTGSYLDETEFFTNSTDWQHITGTYDQDTGQGRMRLYSNGNLVDTALSNNTSGINFSTGSNIRIGTNTGDDSFFGGNIAQVSIYNRALSAAEISQNFIATRSRYGI